MTDSTSASFKSLGAEAATDSHAIAHNILDGGIALLETALSAGEADAEMIIPKVPDASFNQARSVLGTNSTALAVVDAVQTFGGQSISRLTAVADNWMKAELKIGIATLESRKTALGG